jgi:hypothetical protein
MEIPAALLTFPQVALVELAGCDNESAPSASQPDRPHRPSRTSRQILHSRPLCRSSCTHGPAARSGAGGPYTSVSIRTNRSASAFGIGGRSRMTPSVRSTMPFTTSPNRFQSFVTRRPPSFVTQRPRRSCTDQQDRPVRLSTGNNQRKRKHGEASSCTERYRLGQPPQLMATANLPQTKVTTANLPSKIVDGSPTWHAYCCRTKPERRCTTSRATMSVCASAMPPAKPSHQGPSFACCSARSMAGSGCLH